MTQQDSQTSWYNSNTLIITWFCFFFPVGIYGLWKNTNLPLNQNQRWIMTGAVIAIFLISLGFTSFRDFLIVFALCPFALFLLWKDKLIKKNTKIAFSVVFAIFLILFIAAPSQYTPGPECAGTFTQNGCTYFRDSQCNVISRQCN